MGSFKGVFLLALALGLLLGVRGQAEERLVLIGGGSYYNEAAIAQFVAWANEAGGKILRISWATEHPLPAGIVRQAAPFPEGSVIEAPSRIEMLDRKTEFLEKMLPYAGGVYFTGGDQKFIMGVLKDEDLYHALRTRFSQGVVFGGTSAGLAIMSRKMFTGDGVEDDIDPSSLALADGLGLLRGVMLDQHFLKQKRTNRLFGAMLGRVEPLGIGVDEDSAITVENNQTARVLGPKMAMVVTATPQTSRLNVEMLLPGQKYDLVKRSVVSE